MRLLISLLILLCVMTPVRSTAKEFPSFLRGKTIEFKGIGKGCLEKHRSNCMPELKTVHRIYFSNNGNMFVYFDTGNPSGLVVKKGSMKAKKRISLNGNVTKQEVYINFNNNIITYNAKISERPIYSSEYISRISISNNKCRLISYKNVGRVIAGNLIFNSSPVYCKIYKGR